MIGRACVRLSGPRGLGVLQKRTQPPVRAPKGEGRWRKLKIRTQFPGELAQDGRVVLRFGGPRQLVKTNPTAGARARAQRCRAASLKIRTQWRPRDATGVPGEPATLSSTSLALWAIPADESKRSRRHLSWFTSLGPLRAKKGRFCETNPILAKVAWASLVVIQIVKELSAHASNTLRRERIGRKFAKPEERSACRRAARLRLF